MSSTVTRDFNRSTRSKLAKRGVTLLSPVAIPGPSGTYLDSVCAYNVSDNGTHRIWRFSEVMEAADVG